MKTSNDLNIASNKQSLESLIQDYPAVSLTDFEGCSTEDLEVLTQDLITFKTLKNAIQFAKKPTINLDAIHPIRKRTVTSEEINSGKTALHEGRVALFILAGGDGSRLGFGGPKGSFPLQENPHLSLFKIHFSQAQKKSDLYHRSLPIIILTSDNNHHATELYLEEHDYFHYSKESVLLLKQESIPFLSPDYQVVFQSPHKLARGPNGNAGFLKALSEAPFLEKLQAQGVSYLHVIPIDNPLAYPFDEELIGACCHHGLDIALRCVERDNPEENMGIIVESQHTMEIIDYPDFPKEAYLQKLPSGKLLYPDGSINLFCMSISWLKEIQQSANFDYHVAKKTYPCYNPTTKTYAPTSIIKAELFITDLLKYAKKSLAVPTSKEQFFCPLKGPQDIDRILTVLTQQKDQSN